MDITKEMADVAAEFGMSKYASKMERDAALLQEIVRLRAELAGDAEYLEGYKEGMLENIAELAEQLKQTRHKLAASQAREKVLRKGLLHAANCLDTDGNDPHIDAPLDLPADDTALRQAIAKAQEEMRERCIEEVRGVGGIDAIEVERLIRALEVKP